jgi:hypothetical protein
VFGDIGLTTKRSISDRAFTHESDSGYIHATPLNTFNRAVEERSRVFLQRPAKAVGL